MLLSFSSYLNILHPCCKSRVWWTCLCPDKKMVLGPRWGSEKMSPVFPFFTKTVCWKILRQHVENYPTPVIMLPLNSKHHTKLHLCTLCNLHKSSLVFSVLQTKHTQTYRGGEGRREGEGAQKGSLNAHKDANNLSTLSLNSLFKFLSLVPSAENKPLNGAILTHTYFCLLENHIHRTSFPNHANRCLR